MSVTSFSFLCCFGIALILYYVLPKKVQWGFLLLISGLFFCSADDFQWYLIIYPMIAALSVYLAARYIDRTKEQEKKKRAALVCAVFLCILLLCVLKFFKLGLLIPMGISFYTLTLLGYLYDVYYEIGTVEHNFFKLLLFGFYFPTLTSGPIMKYREMKERLYAPHKFDYRQVTFGIQRMIWGIFKKLALAERAALIANPIFDNYSQYSGIAICIGALAFTAQLYMDFSGLMDIVIGMSQCFGITLPENFNGPFLSRNISEYWRRWHMTLGGWLKEYLFYPLLRTRFFMNLPKKLKEKAGKKRAKQITTFLAMFILWFVIGYWHGGTMNYVIGSGLLQWFYIVTGELMEPLFIKWRAFFKITDKTRWFVWFQRLRTLILVTVGNVFFRCAEALDGAKMLSRTVKGTGLELFSGGIWPFETGDMKDLVILLAGILLVSLVTWLNQKEDVRERVARCPLPIRWVVYYGLVFAAILFCCYGPGYSASEFIYGNVIR